MHATNMIRTAFQEFFWWRNQSRWDGKGMWHTLEIRDAGTDLWLGSLKKRVCLIVLGVDGCILLKWIVNERDGKLWSGFVWLRIGTCVEWVGISASEDRLCTEHLCSCSGVPRGGWLGGFKPPPPKFRSFVKVEPDCKLSGKCLVFLFQHLN